MKAIYRKTLLALTVSVAMVGCTKAPNTVNPGTQNPGVGVVSPSTTQPSCGDTYTPPTPAPVVAPFVAPLCNYLAFTANIGCYDKLFLYDDILKDNYALPGAGENVNNPQYFDGDKIIFDRCGRIFVYDLKGEVLCALNDINGLGVPVHRPSASWAGDKVVFTDYCGRAYLWCCNPCISVCELAKINALGRINWIRISADGLWAVFTTCEGCLYVYDICNPMVCLIADARDVCVEGCDKELAFITHPAISATGRQIAFTAVGFGRHGCPKTSIWRYDRVTGCLDPMPFANAALNNLLVVDPLFKCYDEENIYYEALIPGFREKADYHLYTDDDLADIVALTIRLMDSNIDWDDLIGFLENAENYVENANRRELERLADFVTRYLHMQSCDVQRVRGRISTNILEGFRVLDYNWLTETVRTLTIVNNVHGDTETLISDPDLFCCPDWCDYDGKRYGDHDDHDDDDHNGPM